MELSYTKIHYKFIVTLFILLAMAIPLKIFSWNVRGIMSSALCLNRTLDLLDVDIAVICEHKLSATNMLFLESLHPDYTAFPQNQETLRTEKNHISVLVKKSLLFSISYLSECETDRIIGLKISTPTTAPVYLFGVYLPFDNNVDAYKHYISMLWDLWNLFNEHGDVIMLGDFNARYAELPTSYVQRAKSHLLTDFIQSNDITPLNKTDKCSGLGYTFSTNY